MVNTLKKIATMIDLDGPRVRVNNIDGGEAYLEEGDKFVYIRIMF